MATNGTFHWNELMTRNAEAAKRFYGATLGWTFEAMDQDGSAPTMTGAYAPDEFYDDLMRVTGGQTDAALARLTIERSSELLPWTVVTATRSRCRAANRMATASS